jgi:hypothetical protein
MDGEIAQVEGWRANDAVIEGKNRIVVQDVLVGEVWLCSGQSNMGMLVEHSKDFEAEKKAADLPLIRMFTVRPYSSAVPQTNCSGAWLVCSPEAVGKFSATALTAPASKAISYQF